MSDKRVDAVKDWAELVQALSPDVIDLQESAAAAVRAGDLARSEAARQGVTFESEPSAFVKLLNDLAPEHGNER